MPNPSDPRTSSDRRGAAFSSELEALLVRFDDRPVQVREVLDATQARGWHLLLLLIALPFVGPVPLPGFSIPFGLVLTILGGALAVGHKPWLPGVLLRRQLSPRVLSQALHGTSRLMAKLELLLRPRLGFVDDHAFFNRVAGFFIMVSGLFMMLPFPLPFSNSLPAWTVIFLAAGALGHDGLFFLIGCLSFALSVAFFSFVAVGGAAAWEHLVLWVGGP